MIFSLLLFAAELRIENVPPKYIDVCVEWVEAEGELYGEPTVFKYCVDWGKTINPDWVAYHIKFEGLTYV